MKPLFIFLLFILSHLSALPSIIGQPDTAYIGSLYRQAVLEVDKINFQKAREICDQLLVVLEDRDSFSLSTKINTYWLRGAMLRHEHRYNDALMEFHEAFKLAKQYFPSNSYEQAIAYYQIAWIYEQAYQIEDWKLYLDSAAMYFQKAFAPDDCWNGRIWQGRARMNFFNFGTADSTLFFLRKATTIYQHCPGGAAKAEFDLAKIYYDVYLSLRQFDSAEFYLKKEIDYTNTQKGPMWDIQRAWMELNKAHLFRLNGHYEKAISHYQYAKTLFGKVDKDSLPLINSDLYTALCMNGVGRHKEAIVRFRDLIDFMNVFSKNSIDTKGLVYEGVARAYASDDQCDSAIHYARKSIEAFSNMVSPENPKLFMLYLVYGRCLSKLQQHHEADSILQFAYQAALKVFGDEHPMPVQINLERCFASIRLEDFKKASSILDSISQLEILKHNPELSYLYTIASAEILVRQTGNNKLSDTEQSELISILNEAMQKFRDMRNQYLTEEARARSVSSSIAGLQAFMPKLFQYYSLNPGKDLYHVMLQISETHRGIILSEAMGQSEAYLLAGIPDDLQNKERTIKAALSQIRKKIDQEYTRGMPKKEYISKLLAEQIEQQSNLDQLIEAFQQKYPEYFRAKFANEPIRVDELQNRLNPDDVLAEYLVVNNEIYTFVITREQTNVYEIEDGTKQLEKVNDFVHTISNWSSQQDRHNQIKDVGYELYKELIHPFTSMLHPEASLIIIPDKSLHYLPFELLRTGSASNENEVNKNYLIYHYPIQYQSSIMLWMDNTMNQDEYVNHVLTVSPSFVMNTVNNSTRGELLPLDFAEKESNTIHELLGGKWLSKEKASKANFIRQVSRSDLIHLATHARADDRSGTYSWLAFSPASRDSLLYMDEIYRLSLDARMVVLSGCETGIGPLQSGEGLISLSRAFSYAGAESIITSLWPVNDEATATIMTSFYKNLKAGKSKDKALQLAKIEYLEQITDPSQADPYYWAGFIAMGNMSPLKYSHNFFSPWMIVGLIITGIGIFIFIRKYLPHRKTVRQ